MARRENYHFGCLFVDYMRKRDPNDIFQIDAATGEEETFGSVLSRSIQLARSLRNYGLRPGDVLVLTGRNHLDLHIPHYAAICNGLPLIGIDPSFKLAEIKALFDRCRPRIVFCDQYQAEDYKRAIEELGLDCKIVIFDNEECNLKRFIEEYDTNEPEQEYECPEFDPDKIYAWLICTSGTTGLPKIAAFLHRPLMAKLTNTPSFTQGKQIALHLSPAQWISSYIMAVAPALFRDFVKLQTSRLDDLTNHTIDIIQKCRPTWVTASPATFISIIKSERPCDLTCFQLVAIAGSSIHKQNYHQIKARLSKTALLLEAYGQTETYGVILRPNPMGPIGNCGIPIPNIPIKLVDPETGKEITEPNVAGEMWCKGPRLDCYYGDPEGTKNAFTEDGWLKTGDLLYRDENNNYFFVERLKLLMKFRGYHINPMEIEEIILSIEGVEEVVVSGIPHELDLEHPVAFVVKKPGSEVTAEEIKKVVADNLSDSKQLRGGVVFVNEIPKSSVGKVLRVKVREMARDLKTS